VIAAALLLAATAASAQVAVRAQVGATRVGVDDQVDLEVVIEGRTVDLLEEPAIGALDNLRLLGRPSVATQISFVNGSVTQARRYTFLLQAIQPGTATIGPVRVTLPEGPRDTAPITLEVVPGSVLPPRRQADPFADVFGPDPFEQLMARRRQPAAPASAGAIAVEAVASRTRLFVGEPLLLTYYLLTQTRVTGIDFDEPPKYQGFWAEELPAAEAVEQGSPVTRGGQTFRRFAVFRRVLFPTKAGALTVPPARFRVSLPRQIGFFVDPQASQVAVRASNGVEITADPLPAGAPATGAVGSFRAAATLDRSALTLGEAATLRFKVSGRGNLKWVERSPELAVAGAKVYPPQVKSELVTGESGVSGARTWEYVIVPESAGRLAIPALSFDYFDPQERRVVRAETAPLALAVAPGALVTAATSAAPPAAAPAGLRLRSDLDAARGALPRLSASALAAAVLAALALHAALLGGAVLAGRRRERDRPGRRSTRHALADLRRAGAAGGTKEAAALLIERTLLDVFGEVDERGEGGDERERTVREILRDVRFVRYAPQLGDYSEKIREAAARAADAVRRWA